MITKNELIENAEELTALSNNIKIIDSLIGYVSAAAKQGDKFASSYFFGYGDCDNITESLNNIANSVQRISNDICPTEGDLDE